MTAARKTHRLSTHVLEPGHAVHEPGVVVAAAAGVVVGAAAGGRVAVAGSSSGRSSSCSV